MDLVARIDAGNAHRRATEAVAAILASMRLLMPEFTEAMATAWLQPFCHALIGDGASPRYSGEVIEQAGKEVLARWTKARPPKAGDFAEACERIGGGASGPDHGDAKWHPETLRSLASMGWDVQRIARATKLAALEVQRVIETSP